MVNEDQAQRLGDLLLRHAGNGFMGSGHGLAEYARVASYDPRTPEKVSILGMAT